MSQKIRKSIALMLGTAIISMPMPTYASGFLNIVITADPKLEPPAVEPEISESEAPVAEPEIIEPEPPVVEPPIVEPPIVELPVVSEELDLETFGQTKIQKITKNNMDMLNDEVSSISRYAFVPKRVIFEEDDILYVVDVASINKTIPVTDSETNYTHQIDNWIDHAVIIDGFNVHNLEKVSSQEIPLKLPIFAGFHAGEDFNFILSGQSQEKYMTIANGVPKESWEEDLNLEIIRVDKFSKEFNRLGSTRINSANIFTVSPFESGTTSMVTNGNNLIIHSGREMLENKDDGINHQAQLTIDIDIDTMTHTNPLKNWNQPNYVSHSFNQFAKYDGDQPILLDLGDAYPRSVVITKYGKPDAEESWRYETIDAFKIPGTIGANQTGVTVGGFEISENNYLTAINAINYDLATGFNSYEIEGLTKEERDIIILVTNKENEETQEVKLTDYEDTNTLGGTPKLVSIGNNQFMVLWNEFTGCIYKKNVFGQFEITIKGQNLKYVIIDENGTKLSEIKTFTEGKLSQYVQPIKIGNKVVWVAGENYYSIFLN